MKKTIAILCLVSLLSILVFSGCAEADPLEEALDKYTSVVEGEMPEDIRLTIYFIPFSNLTRAPVSKESLIESPNRKITVRAEELAAHWEQFRELKPSALQLAAEKEQYINARLCYILEVGDGAGNYEIILDVLKSYIHGNAFVNGVEVEHTELLFDLIRPFMTEKDWDRLMYIPTR